MDSASPRARRPAGKLLGGVLAVLFMLALAALAWYLLNRPKDAGPGAPGAAASGARAPGGGGGAGAGGPGGGRGGRGGMATTVGVAKAERGAIPVLLDALGTVVPSATATVRPQVSGIVQKIQFAEGQSVRQGQVLASIDPRPFEMALLQATGNRQRTQAQLDAAKLQLERFRTLLAQDSIARQDVDTQAALVKQLEGAVTTDRAAESAARLNLAYTQVKAPISGRVGLRNVDIGNLVNSNDASGLAVITRLAPADVEFTLPQDRLPELQKRLRQGARLRAVAFDRTRTQVLAEGRFMALDNQVDLQTGTVRAKARFDNDTQMLFPSQFVNLRLELDTIADAVLVPVSALRHGGNGDYVYVLNPAERTVALRNVTRGLLSDDKVQIVSGLQGGEQVITEGADRLKDGAKVTLPSDRPGARGGRNGGAGAGEGRGAGTGGREGAAARGPGAPAGAGTTAQSTPAAPVAPAAPARDGARQ